MSGEFKVIKLSQLELRIIFLFSQKEYLKVLKNFTLVFCVFQALNIYVNELSIFNCELKYLYST